MPLTDAAIRSAKVDAGKAQTKKADGGGLYLLVRANGSKLWQMAYRFAGVRKTLSFGAYPEVSLAEARAKREEAKDLLRGNIDPSAKKKVDRAALKLAQDNTFGAIVTIYIDKLKAEGRADVTIAKNEWLLQKLAKPLSDRPIRDITAAEILDVLKSVWRSGRHEAAHRLRGSVGSLFRFAIANLYVEIDPTYSLRGALPAHKQQNHPAILRPKEFGRLLVMIDEYDGWPTLTAALKIQALCFARPYETRTMEWRELDLDHAKWSIPAKKMKMRADHDVPLSRQALAVLVDIRKLSGRGRLVFPQIRNDERPLSENAMNAALRRMGIGKEEHCAHGFRSTASTMLNERGFDEEWIEQQLAHSNSKEVRKVYNRARYWPQRVEMMQAWADLCDEMKGL